ncbi:hypothetical protein CWE09_12950 [Aliidiomarina minuta]|uniref:Uncharacterized protein n=1 Tax=Aliidiomarina minuta TaxID=880057 RepID=A0A432W411_9GAMM|nr:hypothetical protein [Aliidiomarina minuta]RUO24046.1 hypothetical protein CWE09_12950 [Aliidiomarina minuta]
MKNVPLMLMLGTVLVFGSVVVGTQTSAHLMASADQPCVHLDGVTSSPSSDYDCKQLDLAPGEKGDGLSWPRWLASSRSFQFHYLDLIELMFSAKQTDNQYTNK